MIHVTLIPGNKLLDSEARQEIKKYGVYFLFVVNEDKAKPIAYIEIWYNRKRRHPSLNYATFEEFNNKINYKNVA